MKRAYGKKANFGWPNLLIIILVAILSSRMAIRAIEDGYIIEYLTLDIVILIALIFFILWLVKNR